MVKAFKPVDVSLNAETKKVCNVIFIVQDVVEQNSPLRERWDHNEKVLYLLTSPILNMRLDKLQAQIEAYMPDYKNIFKDV